MVVILDRGPGHLRDISAVFIRRHAFLRHHHHFAVVDQDEAGRPIRHCRKNFLFTGSDNGGERAAATHGLICSCKLNDINPRAQLKYNLTHIADHNISHTDELPPWNDTGKLPTQCNPPSATS